MSHLLADTANLIRNILSEQYDIKSILKELVQNADDGGASSLHFAWMPGWPDSSHPLLRDPALVVLNDSKLRPEDCQGIRWMGLGGQGDDASKVGKFGLGLKSVFHFCEAFFYLGSPNQPGAQGNLLCDIINPWPSELNIHNQWDEIGDASERIAARILSWKAVEERWFCLWIPLRTRQQLAGKEALYGGSGAFPTKENLFESDVALRAATLLPFARCLRSIQFWDWDETTQCPVSRSRVLLKPGTSTRYPLLGKMPVGSRKVSGEVLHETHTGLQTCLRFVGTEIRLQDVELDRLKNAPDWPRRSSTGPRGEYNQTPDQALSHAAVLFLQGPVQGLGRGRLHIAPAVFLPLSEDAEVSRHFNSQSDFTLFLHGFFFPDSGRRRIKTVDGDTDDVQIHWNRRLENIGVLPLVLPTLEAFLQESDLSEHDTHMLTGAIARSAHYAKNRDRLCQEHQWICLLKPGGRHWQLLSNTDDVLTIPLPRADDWDLPFRVLPALRDLLGHTYLTCQGWSYLAVSEPSIWGDDKRWMERFELASICTDEAAFDYFLAFLQQESAHLDERAKWRLQGCITDGIVRLGLDAIRRFAERFRNLVDYLATDAWVALPDSLLEKTASDRSYEALLQLGLQRLLLPMSLTPSATADRGSSRRGRFTLSDAQKILRWLNNRDRNITPVTRVEFALAVLEQTEGTTEQQRTSCGNFNVFRVYDQRERQHRSVSWNQLAMLREQTQLVRSGEGLTRQALDALPDVNLYSLVGDEETSVTKALLQGAPLPLCNRDFCRTLLADSPTLSDPVQRGPLIEELARPSRVTDGLTTEELRAIRFLLHGNANAYEDISTHLFAVDISGTTSIWGRLLDRLLKRTGQQWRCISPELTRRVLPMLWNEIGIQALDPATVEALLQEEGTDALSDLAAEMPETERLEILREIKDDGLWRHLPLHRTTEGQLTALNHGPIYLVANKTRIPDALLPLVTAVPLLEDRFLTHRYTKLFPSWDAVQTIRVALGQATPSQYCVEILNALVGALTARLELEDDTIEALKARPWLPTTSGPRPPTEVIHIPGLEDELARLVNDPQVQGAFVDVGMIAEEVCAHPAFDELKVRIFPDRYEALDNLALCLEDAPNYHIGKVDLPESFHDFLKAFDGIDPTLLPGITFLRAIVDKIEETQCRSLAGSMCREITIPGLSSVLTALAEKHEKDGAKSKSIRRAAHTLYLRTLVGHRELRAERLRGLRLLNRAGRWQRVESLCLDGLSLNDEDVLDKGQADVVRDYLSATRHAVPSYLSDATETPGVAQAGHAADSGVTHLREYFRRWRGYVPEPAIGGFLALLGNQPPTLVQTAGEYLQPRTVRGVRDLIAWTPHAAVGAGGNIHEDMDKVRFVFRIIDAATRGSFSVLNLLGEPFQARISDNVDHLLIGEENSFSMAAWHQNGGAYPITLRKIDASQDPSPHSLIELLIETTRILLDKAYYQQPANLDDWMKTLADTGQFDLDRARAKILYHAFFYFRQLNHEALQPLKELSKRWEDLLDREVEAQQASKSNRDIPDILEARERLRSELRNQLEKDPDISSVVLASVRQKVDDYNYAVDSIPFEIFQNADDAVVELAEMRGSEALPLDADHIVILAEAPVLRFVHWGRPINAFRLGTFSSEAGKRRGFHDDLVKMLVLQSSDKSSEGDAVTGKFGLGFKSCFLFTDTPRVLSGQLGFEVAAGVFPAPLEDSDRERLQNEMDRQAATRDPGTIIEMRGREGSSTEKVLVRFRKLAPLLLPFARRLRRLTLLGVDGQREHLVWEPHSLTSCVQVGVINANAGSIVTSGMILVLRGRDNGALMFHLHVRGLTPLPESVPTFWVTAPTDENHNAGLAINGDFKPDVGRRRLPPDSAHNRKVAQQLGEDAAAGFRELYSASQEWDTFIRALRLSGDMEPYVFWESLFDLLAKPECYARILTSAPLLKAILWERGCGMISLLTEKAVLPSGLHGGYRVLTRLPDVQFVTRGALDFERVFSVVATWPHFQNAIAPELIVSGAAVWDRLAPIVDALPETRPIHLLDVLRWEVPAQVLPETAIRIGAVVDETFIGQYGDVEKDGAETESLREYLRHLQFQAQDGSWHATRELIVMNCAKETSAEEERRAAFAPDSRRLNASYQDAALAFFKVCRQKMETPATVMAEWASQAVNAPERWKSFLKYLATGESQDQVGEALDEQTRHKLKTDLQDENADTGLSQEERTKAAGASGVGMDEIQKNAQDKSPGNAPEKRRTAEPKSALDNLWGWWQEEQAVRLTAYDHKVYPSPEKLFADLQEEYRRAPSQRQAWLTLLLRGTLETMGWYQDTSHRNFLSLCERRGWLREMTADTVPRERLVEHIETYMEEQAQDVPYFQWLRQYVPMFILARWLDDYARSFLSINGKERPFSLLHILSPKTNPDAQGELYAPPIGPVLGIGSHFVLRELARKRILTSPQAHCFSYFPSAGVRRVIAALGGPELDDGAWRREDQSCAIHTFLKEHLGEERATFAFAFDIPFQILDEDVEIQQRILGDRLSDPNDFSAEIEL